MSDDAALGKKTRELMQILADTSAMLALDAPTPALQRQVDSLEGLCKEIASECGVDWDSEIVDLAASKMGRITELIMLRAAAQDASDQAG